MDEGGTGQADICKVEGSWPKDLADVEIEALQDNRVEGGEGQNFVPNKGSGSLQEAQNEVPQPVDQDTEGCRLGLASSPRRRVGQQSWPFHRRDRIQMHCSPQGAFWEACE